MIFSFILTLRLVLLKSMSNRRHICRRTLDGPLPDLRVKIGHKLKLTRTASSSDSSITKTWSLNRRRVRRIEPRRMSRLTLLVTIPSIATTILLIDLQSRQSSRDVINTAGTRPNIRIVVAADLRSPVVACSRCTPGRRSSDRAGRVLTLALALLRRHTEIASIFFRAYAVVLILVLVFFFSAGRTRALSA